ncbi:MAG: acyl carrier protein [Planctomycetes bacterium]|nr:acyl carrier protein [Planctomycetota bacterium]
MQLTLEEIQSTVDKIMVEEFEVDPERLRPDAQLVADLDLDSLDGVDLVVALEKTFSCRIPEQEARGIRTLGDIYARVEAGLHGAPEPS